VNEIYHEVEGRPDLEFGGVSANNFRFQFQIKHLLILTAVVAVGLTVAQMKIFGAVLAILALVGAGGALAYMDLQQQRRWAAAQRRFLEKYEKRRQFFERRLRPQAGNEQDAPTIYDDLNFGEGPGYAEWATETSGARAPLRFQFSLWQLFLTVTIASLGLGLIYLMGGPANVATLLGFIALGGLFIYAFGFEPPEFVVLSWWFVLLLYIIVSVGAAIATAL
jgi:hypothetical protein